MRHLVGRLCAVIYVAVYVVASTAPVAAQQVALSQQIQPLQCTVDVITVGPTLSIHLSPAECVHSAAARHLLTKTIGNN
ncbi:hypothetical protein IPL68_00715 [Candidatus Saccharibacteria bacterium]|nr:MAG: hypothetical protein IPL68_00715 [Candidatus Saccharibacteria bacterium]